MHIYKFFNCCCQTNYRLPANKAKSLNKIFKWNSWQATLQSALIRHGVRWQQQPATCMQVNSTKFVRIIIENSF